VVQPKDIPELRKPTAARTTTARTTTNVRKLQARLAAATELATLMGYGAELKSVIADVDAAITNDVQ
jgi:hypothetical protein